jgi:hypothetical protein
MAADRIELNELSTFSFSRKPASDTKAYILYITYTIALQL